MKIPEHVVIGGAASLLLAPVLGPESAVFWASSWLIDVDHYLDYIYRNGFHDFSIKRAMVFNQVLNEEAKGKPFIALHLLHTAEFLGLVASIGAISGNSWVWALLWGILLHLGLDLVYVYSRHILFWRAFSIGEFAVRWTVMKRGGKHPELPYHRAMQAISWGRNRDVHCLNPFSRKPRTFD
jgi:hypothetical protein